ncbi:Zinc finger protein 474 [Hondaea fermentalgiana]|uniref:Zinc finger protein 474 n=1 Tax=Hondaea fermentalgiana TaxID=2315210 RepID=A0A2R5GPW6_9STRA|nr:Zinc finger protein 474 [Hondaea fermentalgiana]|eukprot:GBG31818.1 Zinc finger protein 474 [Hondaea fermentalgiana]
MNGMQQRPLGRGPKAVTCYICGRGYGTNSIGIHIKQCQKLFLAQEAQKPKHERRPLPQPPKDADVTEEDLLNVRPGKANNVDWDKFNDAAFDTFNKEALRSACMKWLMI